MEVIGIVEVEVAEVAEVAEMAVTAIASAPVGDSIDADCFDGFILDRFSF